jgi:hypothetical protein
MKIKSGLSLVFKGRERMHDGEVPGEEREMSLA